MDPDVPPSTSPDEPPRRPRDPLAWIVPPSAAIAVGAFLFAGSADAEARGWDTRVARALGAVVVAFAAGGIAWRLSARSKRVFRRMSAAVLLLLAFSEYRIRRAQSANAEVLRAYKSEIATLRGDLFSEDPAARSAAHDRLVEATRRAASGSKGDLALVLRATTEVMEPRERHRKEYEAALGRWVELSSAVATEDALRARRAAVLEVVRLARRQEADAAGLEAALADAMARAGVARRLSEHVLAASRPKRGAFRMVAHQELVIAQLLAEQESVLEEHWGHWRLEEATGAYVFDDPAVAQRMEDLQRRSEEAEEVQDQARRRAFGGTDR